MSRLQSRSEFVRAASALMIASGCSRIAARFAPETTAGWEKYRANPVLGGTLGTCFDVCVLREAHHYRMWFSWRPKRSIALTESSDGISWSAPRVVLVPRDVDGWEGDVNRPAVLRLGGEYHLWYTGQSKSTSAIGYARSSDGVTWKRRDHPVLVADAHWEGAAVMSPDVLWDRASGRLHMWYSAGQQYEPNAVGYASSADGITWAKPRSNPVLVPDPNQLWEHDRVTAPHIVHDSGWYYAFFIGFRDIDHAQIGLARSRTVTGPWERHPRNPIIRPGRYAWDGDACYKPFALRDGNHWKLWYNGRRGHIEQIGLATHNGGTLGFNA